MTEPAAKDAPGIVTLSVRCGSKPRHHEDNQQGDPHEILHQCRPNGGCRSPTIANELPPQRQAPNPALHDIVPDELRKLIILS